MSKPKKGPSSSTRYRCVCCGSAVPLDAFTLGALGHYSTQVTTRTCVGRPYGTGGGSFVWSRRPMQPAELERMGAAITTAAHVVGADLNEPPVDIPNYVASLDDDEAASKLGVMIEAAERWLAELHEIARADARARGLDVD